MLLGKRLIKKNYYEEWEIKLNKILKDIHLQGGMHKQDTMIKDIKTSEDF